jgi:hypothetical protein
MHSRLREQSLTGGCLRKKFYIFRARGLQHSNARAAPPLRLLPQLLVLVDRTG